MNSVTGFMPDHEGAKQVLESQVSELFFNDTRFRPHPADVANLITRGANEGMIGAAALHLGRTMPTMELTRQDLELALPYIHIMSDVIAETYPNDRILFAGRDAEALFDDFTITHPDVRSHLMPASKNLWQSTDMRDHDLATGFLMQYGITKQSTRKPDGKFMLVDTGFMGSIGKEIDFVASRLFHAKLIGNKFLEILLVCADEQGDGIPILRLPKEKQASLSPKYRKRYPIVTDFKYPNYSETNTFTLAVNLQNMPRFHGSFAWLDRLEDDSVVALPTLQEKTRDDVDTITFFNDSVINPVAAAITQYQVVAAAMKRSGRK